MSQLRNLVCRIWPFRRLIAEIDRLRADIGRLQAERDEKEEQNRLLREKLASIGLQSQMMRQECYSQEGEDLIVSRIFAGKSDGFYVDVGAYDPVNFSNTYLLHRRGWRGINIDATPNSMEAFRRSRPEDINVEAFVSIDEAGEFYLFNEPALNTGRLDVAQQHMAHGSPYVMQGTTRLKSRSLASILDEFLPAEQKIDFLNVDAEGLDLEVLKSNDWHKYKPLLIAVEIAHRDVDLSHPVVEFLRLKGYKVTSWLYNTVLFTRAQ